MKIIVAFSCEGSSILNTSIIDAERNYISSSNAIISLGTIPCFHLVTIMLYIWKVIIAKTTMSDCGWPINGSHKWSENSNLHVFFCWTITEEFLFIWWISAGICEPLCIILPHILLFISQLVLKNILIYIRPYISFIFSGKCGSSLIFLILNLPNKKSVTCLENW